MSAWQDLRQGVRLLVREPGFAVVAILTLALGIGANTMMFGVIDAVLLNPFPYRNADGLLQVGAAFRDQPGFGSIPPGIFRDWKQQADVFETLSAARGMDVSLTEAGEPAQVHAALVSADVFPMLGVEPALGRVFRPDEDVEGAQRVAVLSWATWQQKFGADPQILGRSIRLDDQAYTVVGVMPSRFKLWAGDVWLPWGLDFDGPFKESRVVNNGLFGLARLKPGVSMEQARAQLAVMSKRLADAHPDTDAGLGVSMVTLNEAVTGGIRPALLVLLGAVAFLLLIACANVANLLLARAAGRAKELSVRRALGASRGRLVRLLLLETVPMAVAGAAAGIALAFSGLRGLIAVLPPDAIPAEADLHLPVRVLVITTAVCLLTMVVFALLPALQASRSDVTEGLKEGARGASAGRGGQRLRSALIVGEVALSLALLVGAGLLIRSFSRLSTVDPGFRTEGVLHLRVKLPEKRYAHPDRSQAFFEDALGRIAAQRRVRHAGIGPLPFSNEANGMPLAIEGRTYASLQDLPNSLIGMVMGDYFPALGIRLHAGRLLDATDTQASEPVVVVNRALARQHFGDADPVGKRILVGVPEHLVTPGLLPEGVDRFPWRRVVGVVDDVKHFRLGEDPVPVAYMAYAQAPRTTTLLNNAAIVVRTDGDPLDLVGAVREQVWAIDRTQPVLGLGRLETLMAESLRQPRFGTLLLGLFAALAIALSAVGLYGVVSYTVSQRTREVGIRMALGADRGAVQGLVVRQGMTLVAGGLVLGLALALGLGRFLSSMLYQVPAGDPLTFACVAAFLLAVALVACSAPARRAASVDPMIALRSE